MATELKYALFLGCTIPARSRNYELSARRVAEALGIQFVDIKEFMCCGFPMKGIEEFSAEVMAAYNLSLAQKHDLDLCTLCSSCTSALTEVVYHTAHGEKQKLEEINKELGKTGLKYEGGVKVRHFARILYEEVGTERIKEKITKELKGLRIAVHYGCHYLKPSEIYDGFDRVDAPESIDALVKVTGAEVVDYPGKKKCCGGPVLPVDEKVAMAVTKEKLDQVKKVGANAICLVCPFCSVMYDGNQKSIEAEFGVSYDIPVLYLTQILGLAMGFDRKALGLNMNVVKTKKLLKDFVE